MIRFAASFVLSFVLIYIQSVIVMKLNGYTEIHFGNLTQLTIVYIVNFFLVFSILTHIQPWIVRTQSMKQDMAEEE